MSQLSLTAWATISMQDHLLTHLQQLHVNSWFSFKNNPNVLIARFSFRFLLLTTNQFIFFAKGPLFLSKYIKWILLHYQYFFLLSLGTTEGLRGYLKTEFMSIFKQQASSFSMNKISQNARQTKGILSFLLFPVLYKCPCKIMPSLLLQVSWDIFIEKIITDTIFSHQSLRP